MADKVTEREERKNDKKKSAVDKSTPEPADPSLTIWLEGLFRDDERADSIKALRVFGRREIDPTPVWQHQFAKSDTPSKEELVAVSNEAMEAMQNDANATRCSMLFEITAHNHQRGSIAFSTRRIRIDPIAFLVESGRGMHGAHLDDGELPGFEDSFRKRAVEAWSDARDYVDKAISTLGGLVHVQAKQLEMKDRHIEKLLDQRMERERLLDEAQSHQLDREMVRRDKEVAIEAKRMGMNILQKLLPDLGKKLLDGPQAKQDSQQPHNGTAEPKQPYAHPATGHVPPKIHAPESAVITSVIDSLNEEESRVIFGTWESGELVKQGILTEIQAKIVAFVGDNKNDPSDLNDLVSGPNQITTEQGFEFMKSVDISKIAPFLALLKARKERIEAVPPSAPKEG